MNVVMAKTAIKAGHILKNLAEIYSGMLCFCKRLLVTSIPLMKKKIFTVTYIKVGRLEECIKFHLEEYTLQTNMLSMIL